MTFFQDTFDPQETIARTGFFASLVSFLVFLLADLARPGFSSNYLSVHWFLILAVIFGVWWSFRLKKVKNYAIWQYFIAVFSGVFLAWGVWKVGEGLSEFRVLVVLLMLLVPVMLLGLARSMGE